MRNSSKHTIRLKSLKNTLNQRWGFLVLFFLIISSTYQCANIQQPTGGPIDSIPPKLLNESPKNLTTNFKDKNIILEFDEFIKLANPSKEISISPDMETLPEFKVKRKNLEIELKDSLSKETTYVINFGGAITDNNEGNALLNYSYVFSTGDKIDSLSIRGSVKNAFTNEAEKQVAVILIPISQDSTFGKKKANIFALTDSSGNFQLRYLRADQYRIYALKEQNSDRIYNNPNESIAFLKDSINLKQDTSGIELWTSKPIEKQFRVLDRKIEKSGKIVMKFNRSVDELVLNIQSPEELNKSKKIEINSISDSLNLWVADLSFDSLNLHILERDTLLDSITLRRPRNDKYERNIVVGDNLDRNMVNRIKNLELTANAPINTIDQAKLKLKEDSLSITNYQILRDSSDNKKFIIRHNWKKEKNYILTIDEGAFNGYFQETNQKSLLSFTFDETDKYGDIKLQLNVPDSLGNLIIELTDEKKQKVFKKDVIQGSTTINYKRLLEGNYKLRVIYDANNNGIWDPGEIETHTQPEKVWYYDKQFIIRPNWEQEEKISIPKL